MRLNKPGVFSLSISQLPPVPVDADCESDDSERNHEDRHDDFENAAARVEDQVGRVGGSE